MAGSTPAACSAAPTPASKVSESGEARAPTAATGETPAGLPANVTTFSVLAIEVLASTIAFQASAVATLPSIRICVFSPKPPPKSSRRVSKVARSGDVVGTKSRKLNSAFSSVKP